MNPQILAAINNGQLGGSELLFWLVVIAVILFIVWAVRRL